MKIILSYLKSAPSNLPNCKILGKKLKGLTLGPKMAYLDIFGLEFENNIIIFETNTPNLSTCKISWKNQKCLNLGPKLLLCVPYFWAGIWKYYCHIWNLRPRICLVAKFGPKIKTLKFGTKSTWFGFFWARILKNYCHIWNQHPQICLFSKFHEKTKMPKFGTKNAWFRYFWTGTWKQYCHIWNQQPRICLIVKFRGKTKMPKFGTKMPYLGGTKNALFGYFLVRILKKLLSYLKSALSNLSTCKISRKNKNA